MPRMSEEFLRVCRFAELVQKLETIQYCKPLHITMEMDIAKRYHIGSLRMGIDRTEYPDIVTIDFIHMTQCGRGYGTILMHDICAWADARGKTLCLTPDPLWESTREQLDRFYSKFGFVVDTQDRVWATLIRVNKQ